MNFKVFWCDQEDNVVEHTVIFSDNMSDALFRVGRMVIPSYCKSIKITVEK